MAEATTQDAIRNAPFAHVMRQTWHDLLFAHWPVAPEVIQRQLPDALTVDTWEGQAWVAVVPFRMSGIGLRGLPAVPLTRAMLELNVRTYVTLDDKPGVWFHSLDADNLIAVEVARTVYHLPYFHAAMQLHRHGHTVYYASQRRDPRGEPGTFAGQYRPTGEVFTAESGTLAHWLTERYYLYAADGNGGIYRGSIHHDPWALQPAEAHININTVTLAHGIRLPDDIEPLLHYAHRQVVVAGAVERVR